MVYIYIFVIYFLCHCIFLESVTFGVDQLLTLVTTKDERGRQEAIPSHGRLDAT